MFELVVGEVGAILGGLEEEREFPDLVLDAWLGATEAARLQAFDALGQRLEQARAQHEDAKALDEKLFGEDFEAERGRGHRAGGAGRARSAGTGALARCHGLAGIYPTRIWRHAARRRDADRAR